MGELFKAACIRLARLDPAAARLRPRPTVERRARAHRSQLLDLPGVRHAFFTRQGGVSRGHLRRASTSAWARGDDPAAVAENRRRAAAHFGTAEPPRHRLPGPFRHRARGRRRPGPARPARGRRAWSPTAPGSSAASLAADCAPVLLADPEARVVGAAHAGWRGALRGVVEATVAAMAAAGRRAAGASAPPSAPASARVLRGRPGVRAALPGRGPGDSRRHFTPADGTDRRLSTSRPTSPTACAAPASPSQGAAADTFTDEARFFSFRRTTKRGEQRFGVQVSVVGLLM